MDSTKRFSNRVEDYIKYRPGYPAAVIDFLQQEYKLTTDKLIADIGAGTGISSALFLDAGYKVLAVEPNKEMREKAVELLHQYPGFHAIDGTAENTTLQPGSVDAIVAGQAFHWFDVTKSRNEFKRILKEDGLVVLIWNERQITSEFEKAYDQLIIKYGKDYVEINHRNIDAASIAAFYSPGEMHLQTFANKQVFDFEGFKGRLLSSSYMPVHGDAVFDDMIRELKTLFLQYAENGRITINYITNVYTGHL